MTMPEAAPVKLTDEMKSLVNGALANGTPMVFAYVDSEGQPSLSVRGSAQAFSDDQLAVWVRNPSGGFLKALPSNPRVALMYRDPQARTNMFFKGRGRMDDSSAVRDTVYENIPQSEKNADPDRKGGVLLIDIDSVTGVAGGNRIMMRR